MVDFRPRPSARQGSCYLSCSMPFLSAKLVIFFVTAVNAELAAFTRRGLLNGLVVSGLAQNSMLPSLAAGAAQQPVLVLGAGGGTGRACVQALLWKGIPCIATTRSGSFDSASLSIPSKGVLSVAAADVTSTNSLGSLITPGSLSAVIFAASASAKGGDAAAVDRDGVVNAARCCIAAEVPRLCIVSSGAVTRPDSAVYKLLNFVGSGIMEAKIAGEDAVRALYIAPGVSERGLGYTIIRPGGLTPALDADGSWLGQGASAVELNQGDSISGRISRADVASLCVESLRAADAFDTTFECYERDTARPLESVGISNILRMRAPTAQKTGFERRSEAGDWASIFQGLAQDRV